MPADDNPSVEDLLDQLQAKGDAIAAQAGATPAPKSSAPPDSVEHALADAAGAVSDIAAGLPDPFSLEGGLDGDLGLGLGAPPAAAPHKEVPRLLAIEVPVIVQLGMRRMTVGEVMRLAVGAIIEFHKPADEELELLANNKSIGKGHAVKVGENFGIKITAIAPVKDTIRKLGGL